MPYKKNYKKRAIGMIGATIAVGALTFSSVKHSIKQTIRINHERQRFEQKIFQNKQKEIEFKKQLEIQRKKEIRKYIKKSNQKKNQESNKLNFSNLVSNSKLLTLHSKLSSKEARSYLKVNLKNLGDEYKFLSTKQMLQNKKILEPLARKIAKEEGIDADVFVKLIQQESRWDPFAINSGGDVGLCQMNKLLWDSSKTNKYHHNPLNPVENMRVAAKYLSELSLRFKNTKLVLTAYNWGPTRVSKLVNQGYLTNQIVSLNPTNYANKVLSQK